MSHHEFQCSYQADTSTPYRVVLKGDPVTAMLAALGDETANKHSRIYDPDIEELL